MENRTKTDGAGLYQKDTHTPYSCKEPNHIILQAGKCEHNPAPQRWTMNIRIASLDQTKVYLVQHPTSNSGHAD